MSTLEQHRIADRWFLVLLLGLIVLAALVLNGAAAVVRLMWTANAPQDDVAWYWVYSRTSAKSELDLRAPQVTGHQRVYSAPFDRPSVEVEMDLERVNYFWVTAVSCGLAESEPGRLTFFIYEDFSRPVVEPMPWLGWMGGSF